MGKLILCSGVRTNRPYVFPATGIRIYSIEELCYYLYHHIYMIEEDMFTEDLFDWIGSELRLTERAQMLKKLKWRNSDLKTIVTVILCSADYYSESEIKGVLKTLDNVTGMPAIKRNCLKANNCLKNRKYMEAAAEYEKIINSSEASGLTPEEYGNIYHNLGIAKLHITGLVEATGLFAEAYERNHSELSLKQYLYALKLSNNDDEYEEKTEEYQVSEELRREILDYLKSMEEEALYSQLMNEIEHLKRSKAHGMMNEYYRKTDEIIEGWKSRIRQS